MAAKQKLTVLRTPPGRLLFVHIASPDDKAIAGAAWKPDGKYKLTVQVQDLKGLDDAIYAFAKGEFGSNYPGDENLLVPFKAGKRDEDADSIMITAKSSFQPKCFDAAVRPLPQGVFPAFGDKGVAKFSLFPFQKTEKVRVNGKMVDETVYGVSARLLAVQVIEKRGSGDGDGFEAQEGYEAEDAPAAPRSETRKAPVSDSSDF